MRRRPGIHGLQAGRTDRAAAAAAGAERREEGARRLHALMAEFREQLGAVALRRRDDVRADPELRAHFHRMCAALGVDPLVSNKGVFASALGLGDFYYELGVQVVEACLATRPLNGGLIDLADLHRLVLRRRGERVAPVSADDLMRAIDTLKPLGGYEVSEVRDGGRARVLVRSVPRALDTDVAACIEVAADQRTGSAGYVTAAWMADARGWPERRSTRALADALEQGLAWLDAGAPDGAHRYYFPVLAGKLLA